MWKWLMVGLCVCVASPAWAQVVTNSKGTSGAAKSVTTGAAVTVLDANANRFSYCLEPETQNLRCVWGGADGSAPTNTPSSTVGFLVESTMPVCFNARNFSLVTIRTRVDCIAIGGTTGVSTIEEIQ